MHQFNALTEHLRRVEAWLRSGDEGNNLVEYLLLCALIALVCILAVSFLGNTASSEFSSVGGSING